LALTSPKIVTAQTGAIALPGADVAVALRVLRRVKASIPSPPLDFTNTHLVGADLSAMDLVGAQLAGADLRDAKLNDADLTGADLRGALMNERTQLYKTVVSDVRIWKDQIDQAWLSQARGEVQWEQR
jgi:uncharacterized protein YjbI with pentapeptide repeats